MGKYGGGLTLNEVCKLEVEELKEILSKYNVTDEDKENIIDMLREGYFQAHKIAQGGRVLERLLEENNINIDLTRYRELDMEEGLKFKWE